MNFNTELSESICRACLSIGAENTIFSIHKPTSQNYSHIFSSCLSLQVEPDDGLPTFLCEKCLNKLICFYTFKNTVTQNDLILREAHARKKGDKKVYSDLEIINDNDKIVQQFNCTKYYYTESDTVENSNLNEGDCVEEIKHEEDPDIIKHEEFFENDDDTLKENNHDTPKVKFKNGFEKTIHQCDVCGKILSSKSNLNQHNLRKHSGERRHSCSTCGKTFLRAEHVIVHKRTHTGERPHSCTICPKKFVQYTTLKNHLLTHSGERPYMCSVCGKSFSQSSTLSYHMRVHSGETPFTCGICGKKFKSTGNLNTHRRFHSTDRQYSCKICGKSFITSSHLNIHVKDHNGVKSHQCIVCGKAFVRSEHLKCHMIIHTGQKPYACKLCHKKYNQNSHLVRHMKTHEINDTRNK